MGIYPLLLCEYYRQELAVLIQDVDTMHAIITHQDVTKYICADAIGAKFWTQLTRVGKSVLSWFIYYHNCAIVYIWRTDIAIGVFCEVVWNTVQHMSFVVSLNVLYFSGADCPVEPGDFSFPYIPHPNQNVSIDARVVYA